MFDIDKVSLNYFRLSSWTFCFLQMTFISAILLANAKFDKEIAKLKDYHDDKVSKSLNLKKIAASFGKVVCVVCIEEPNCTLIVRSKKLSLYDSILYYIFTTTEKLVMFSLVLHLLVIAAQENKLPECSLIGGSLRQTVTDNMTCSI